jgi:2-methylcitrate dehydratase PrpD
MAAPAQVGDEVIIGFQSFVWTGYVAEDGLTWVNDYNNEEITTDQNGATRSKIRMDEYEELSGSFIIDDPGNDTEVISFKKGDVVSITTPDGDSEAWEIQTASTALAAGALKLTVTMRKEVSVTYS